MSRVRGQGQGHGRRDPGACEDIDEVMANQDDLVEVMHTLRQVVCVKG